DGRAVAWIVPVPRSGQPPAPSLVIRLLPPRAPGGRGDGNASGGDAREIVVDLARAGPGHVVVLDVDMQAREALVAVDERRFVSMGFDGGVRWGPVRPEGVEPIHATFRRVGDGWVAWDGYRESGPYVVAWTLPAGRGTHRVPRGRGITDIAVHPDGRLLALSLTTSLSIGDVQDAVYVLRAAAGGEVFRRFLPRYARSAVAFPAPDLFAYTEWDGTRFATVVLEIPDAVR
ncbi:MAG TPA: hypothetical protein VNN07_15935, partial [Candidatus Tectomicrobia bacterium]|nr:hypothetical protein [Candidatus Tectomicrobia bacterium]